MSHLLGGAVLDVVERRCSKSAENLLNKTFTPQQREQICTINVDIWQPFLKAIQSQLPQALVVHDRFHLVKYLNECMDKVRRKDVATEDILKESRYALLKKEQNFMDKQRAKFKMIKTMNQEVTKVWYLRENFKSLFGISHNDSDSRYRLTYLLHPSYKLPLRLYSSVSLNNIIKHDSQFKIRLRK